MKDQEMELHDFNLNIPASIPGSFRIVTLDIGLNNILSGWLEAGGRYGRYQAVEHEVTIWFDKMQYMNLDHFAGVLGKFDPYAFCLAEPIEIESLNHAALDEIKDRFERYEG